MLIVTPSSTCDVCLDRYSWDVAARTPHSISCGHVFCQQCLRALNPKTCPLCRRPFVLERIRKLHVDIAFEDQSLLQSAIDLEERQFEDRIITASGDNVPDEEAQHAIEEILGWLETRPPGSHQVLRKWTDLVHRYKVLKESYDLALVDKDQFRRRLKRSERERAQDRELAKGIEDSLNAQLEEIKKQYDHRLNLLDFERQRAENELEKLRTAKSLSKLKFKKNPLPTPPKPVDIPGLPGLMTITVEDIKAKGAPNGYIPPSSIFATPLDSKQQSEFENYFKNVSGKPKEIEGIEKELEPNEVVIPPRPDYMLPIHPSKTGNYRAPSRNFSRVERRMSEFGRSFEGFGATHSGYAQDFNTSSYSPQRINLSRSATFTEGSSGYGVNVDSNAVARSSAADGNELAFDTALTRAPSTHFHDHSPRRDRERGSAEAFPAASTSIRQSMYSVNPSRESISSSVYLPQRNDDNTIHGGGNHHMRGSTSELSQLSGFGPLPIYSYASANESRERLGRETSIRTLNGRRDSVRSTRRDSPRSTRRRSDQPEFSSELETRLANLQLGNLSDHARDTITPFEIDPIRRHSSLATSNSFLGPHLRDAISLISTEPEHIQVRVSTPFRTEATYGSSRDDTTTSQRLDDDRRAWPTAAAYEEIPGLAMATYPSGYASEEAMAEWVQTNLN